MLIVNLLMYGLLFIGNLSGKLPGKSYASLVIGLFTVSALCCLLYAGTDLYSVLSEKGQNVWSFLSLLYVFINLMIYVNPLQRIRIRPQAVVVPAGEIVAKLALFIGICSSIAFFENLNQVVHLNAMSIADIYFDKMEEGFSTRTHLSTLGYLSNGVNLWFQYITPVLFFYILTHKQKLMYIIPCFLAFMNPVLQGLLMGGRGALFQTFCIIVFNYLLFKRFFSRKANVRIKLYGYLTGALLASVLLFITFARAEGETDVVLAQIYRYLGEGFINFAEKGWYVPVHTGGYSIFNGTGHTFLKEVSDYFDARDYTLLGQITRMRMYVYYTVFGDYYIDFGLAGGILFNGLLAMLFYRSVRGKENNLTSLVVMNLYARIGLNGIYCFAYMYSLDFILFTMIVIVFLRVLENRNTKQVVSG